MSEKNGYQYLVKLVSFSKQERGVDFHVQTNRGKKVKISLKLYTPGICRFQVVPQPQEEKKRINLLAKQNWDKVDFNLDEDTNYVSLRTEKLKIIVDKQNWQVSIYDKKEKLVWQEQTGDKNVLDQFITLPTGFTSKGGGVKSLRENVLLFPEEHFYGFGEKFTPFDKKSQKIVSWTEEPLGTNTEKSYKNIPFFLSTRGYGIFINTTNRIEYDLGTKSSITYSFTVYDTLMDFYLIYGPKFKDIINQYIELVGKAPVPPKWSFGLWMSKFGYKTRQELEETAEKLREHGIPCDVLHLDPFWMENGKRCNLEWDDKAFPNPREMLEYLKQKGFKVCLWEHPHVPVGIDMFKEGKEKAYFLTKQDGSVYIVDNLCLNKGPEEKEPLTPGAIVDFTNPEAVEWYKEKHRRLLDEGVAVFKSDFGEYVPSDSYFHNGLTGQEMKNIYPLLYNRAVFEVTQEIKGTGVAWGRSAYAGSQKYPLNWSGDSRCTYPSMACNLRAGLGYALCGFPFWSHDIGGFKGTPSRELYLRWTQFGMFTSHSRCHGTTPREPWEFGTEAMDIFRFYAKLRYRLLPYIYSYAQIASQTGLPLMRPMVLEYQEDPNTYDKDLQYMFGREFLVAPVFNESGEVSIYLPEEGWIDYWTHKRHNGPKTVRYKADLKTLPLFVKANSIIPLGPEMNYVGEKPLDPMTLDLYAITNARFTLYDDEESVEFRCDQRENGFVLKIGESQRTYIAKFNKVDEPKRVETKKGLIPPCREREFRQINEGWYFDELKKILWIKAKVKGSETIYVIY